MAIKFSPETGPLPQSFKERVEIVATLTEHAPKMEGQFDEYGAFTVEFLRFSGEDWRVRRIAPGLKDTKPWVVQVPFWSPKLAALDPLEYKLDLDPSRTGAPLSLVGADGTKSAIPFEEIKQVDPISASSGIYTVGYSGYLLRHEPGSGFWETPRFEKQDAELVRVARGEHVDRFGRDNSQYTKLLEVGWEGRRVLYAELSHPTPLKGMNDRPNAIVLLSDPLRLIPWDMESPFSSDKWLRREIDQASVSTRRFYLTEPPY